MVARLTWGWVLWPYGLLAIIVFLYLATKIMLNHEITFGCTEIRKTGAVSTGVVRFVFAGSNTCFNMFST